MTKIILPRRRFLFLAPAVIAASNLMPGHSIAHLLTAPLRDFDMVVRDPLSAAFPDALPILWGYKDFQQRGLRGNAILLTDAEVKHHAPRMIFPHGVQCNYYYPRADLIFKRGR